MFVIISAMRVGTMRVERCYTSGTARQRTYVWWCRCALSPYIGRLNEAALSVAILVDVPVELSVQVF
jgi:hypothetical protein